MTLDPLKWDPKTVAEARAALVALVAERDRLRHALTQYQSLDQKDWLRERHLMFDAAVRSIAEWFGFKMR